MPPRQTRVLGLDVSSAVRCSDRTMPTGSDVHPLCLAPGSEVRYEAVVTRPGDEIAAEPRQPWGLTVTLYDHLTEDEYEYRFLTSPIVLGQDEGACDLVVRRPGVSAVHGQLTFDADSVHYIDLGSRDGSLLGNRKPVNVREFVSLRPGQVVVLGSRVSVSVKRGPPKNKNAFDPFAKAPIGSLLPDEEPTSAPQAVPGRDWGPAAPVPRGPLSDQTEVMPTSLAWAMAELNAPAVAPEEAAPAVQDVVHSEEPSGPAPEAALAHDTEVVPSVLPRTQVLPPEPRPSTPLVAQEKRPHPLVDVGDTLAHYRLEAPLGQGAMGTVFKASHVRIAAKMFAIKVLAPEVTAEPSAEERFLREAQAASQLEHPHIVSVVDYGRDVGVSYLVMEHLTGETLGSRLARGPLSCSRAAEVLLAVSSGVTEAHKKGIIHRDLKPDNIFLARVGGRQTVPKVLDFGIAKQLNDAAPGLSHAKMLIGTPSYMAPEQASAGAPASPATDQYALGAVLYECVTGRRAHDGSTLFAILRSIAEGRIVRPTSLRSDIPHELEVVILRAMHSDPRMRFGSVFDFGKALLPFVAHKRQGYWQDHYVDPSDADMSTFDGFRMSVSFKESFAPSKQAVAIGNTKVLPLPNLGQNERPSPLRSAVPGNGASAEKGHPRWALPAVIVATTLALTLAGLALIKGSSDEPPERPPVQPTGHAR